MAKKGTTTRVFQLAKQIGVSSKDIVAKCQAEEIPGITNHMSAISLGLAATICEWFGNDEGAGGTAVETAAPVDVEAARAKVQKKATRKKAAKKAVGKTAAPVEEVPPAEPPVVAPETVVADEEAPTPVAAPVAAGELETEPPAESPAEPATPPVAAETDEAGPGDTPGVEVITVEASQPDETVITTEAFETIEPAEAVEPDEATLMETEMPAVAATAAEGEELSIDSGEYRVEEVEEIQVIEMAPVMNVPVRPNVVTPAGPKLQQPTKTKLAGPKVIRVESPESVRAPQPRRAARGDGAPGRGGPKTGRGAGVMSGDGPGVPGGPARGGGGGGGASGRASSSSRRNKRRSATARPDAARGSRPGQGGQGVQPSNWREQDLLERERRLNRSAGFLRAARRDNLRRSGSGGHRAVTAAEAGGKVRVEEPITIKSLSYASGIKVNDIIRRLVKAGHDIASADAAIENELAMEVMLEYSVELEVVEQKTAEAQIVEQFKERTMTDERPRSPVVTILGHVDHGKTSLLDRIRQANVAEGEAGGITQATSAFKVPVNVGDAERTITFIDTPGHEAFTEMRSRGAKVTDIVVLVVAADDGVMPQTVESINHAKAAGVPILVALNKIDKPEATDPNIQRILGQLAEHELNPVEWGGQTEIIRTSAVKNEGIEELLETIDYQSQLLELTADFGGRAEGSVIEAQLEEGRGPVARVLVQQGQLKQGDFIVVGRAYGRVRDIVNDHGERIKTASPSTPVAISGINEVPDAGDKLYIVKSIREAESAAQERIAQERQRNLATEKVTLDNIFQKLSDSARKDLPLVIKADVQGSLETLKATIGKIGSEEVVVSIKHAAVGGVNESDVGLAEASGAIVIGFNVTSSAAARRAAETRGVDVRFYDVIYDLTDDVTRAAEGLLAPELKLEVLGHSEVREVFRVSKVGMIAGCYVTEGAIERHAQIRVTRDGIVIEKDRRLEQLKRFKDDVKEVKSGQECGMRIEGYDDIRVGDVLECYKTLEVRRKL